MLVNMLCVCRHFLILSCHEDLTVPVSGHFICSPAGLVGQLQVEGTRAVIVKWSWALLIAVPCLWLLYGSITQSSMSQPARVGREQMFLAIYSITPTKLHCHCNSQVWERAGHKNRHCVVFCWHCLAFLYV